MRMSVRLKRGPRLDLERRARVRWSALNALYPDATRFLASSREIVAGDRSSSVAIARVESLRFRSAAMAYLSPEVSWRYFMFGSPVLGGMEELEVSQFTSLCGGAGVALSI
jgi:hypothetical protein